MPGPNGIHPIRTCVINLKHTANHKSSYCNNLRGISDINWIQVMISFPFFSDEQQSIWNCRAGIEFLTEEKASETQQKGLCNNRVHGVPKYKSEQPILLHLCFLISIRSHICNAAISRLKTASNTANRLPERLYRAKPTQSPQTPSFLLTNMFLWE